ncbi:secretin N-terminal domain-containing protein [Paucibacter soli]|uniref:secretin N-terminal domain-containing protein n=1 Tax=Paucibacter soli TaxID=3133433 RepID=UPI0030AFBE32
MNLTPLVLGLACALLAACALPDRPIIPAPLSLPKTAAAAVDVDRTNRGVMRVEELPAPTRPAATKPATPLSPAALQAASTASSEGVSVNLEQVTLGVFAQLVYADMLKKNVNIDPQVLARKDLVTFRSGTSQAPEQLENAARLLLKSYGVAAIDLGGLVRVLPDNANLGHLPEIRRGTALPETPLPLRPVFQLVELQAVRQTEVVSWLRTLFADRVKVQEDPGRNAVLLSGTPDNMGAALEALRVLDQPSFSGAQSVAITPVYWSADELARRLVDVLNAQGYAVQPVNQPSGVRYPIIVLPVSGLNSVFVFANSSDVVKHITEWARTLDRPNERGIGKNFFTYAVKHTDASQLAQTLEQLLSGVRPSTAAAATTAAAPAGTAAAPARSSMVVVDKASNMLIFQSSQDEHSQLMTLLQTLDRPAKGALIEVTVAELSIDDNNQLGVEWLATHAMANGAQIIGGTKGGLPIGNSGATFRVFDTVGGVRAVLNAMASSNRATILSSPRVQARNGETATIQVGQEVPIVTSQQTAAGAVSLPTQAAVLQTIQYRNTGVILKVKPVIHSGDQIDLDVTQEVSAAQSTSTGVNNSPTFSTRKVDTKLSLKNGATVLLGGLISDENNHGSAGVPYLKDIPLIGALFSNQTRGGVRRELIVLITPYVIDDNHGAEAVTDAFRRMLGPWAGNVPGVRAEPEPSK